MGVIMMDDSLCYSNVWYNLCNTLMCSKQTLRISVRQFVVIVTFISAESLELWICSHHSAYEHPF